MSGLMMLISIVIFCVTMVICYNVEYNKLWRTYPCINTTQTFKMLLQCPFTTTYPNGLLIATNIGPTLATAMFNIGCQFVAFVGPIYWPILACWLGIWYVPLNKKNLSNFSAFILMKHLNGIAISNKSVPKYLEQTTL